MSRLVKWYEWSVILMAAAIVILTSAAIWLQFLDGQVVNVPIVFNDPHSYTLPIQPHTERPTRGITHLTTKSAYKHGEMVEAYVDVVKQRKEPGRLQWQLMDQRFYPYVSRLGVLPEGHHHQVVQIEKIPMHVPAGQYHFSGTVTYKVNMFNDVHIPIRTNCFQVVD